MKSHAKVVVIGGGSWRQRPLSLDQGGMEGRAVDRTRRTHLGSTWHAAGGMHTVNGDPKRRQAAAIHDRTLQGDRSGFRTVLRRAYHRRSHARRHARTARLVEEAKARGRYLGMDLEIISVDEAARLFRCWRRSTSPAPCTIPSKVTSILWRDPRLCQVRADRRPPKSSAIPGDRS